MKYDFGGALDPEGDDWVVVDTKKPYKESKCSWIKADLSKRVDLKQGEVVNVSCLLRYIGCVGGYGKGDPLASKSLKVTAQNIDRALLPGGKVRMLDHLEVIVPVMHWLLHCGYTMESIEYINPVSGDFLGECLVYMKKKGSAITDWESEHYKRKEVI